MFDSIFLSDCPVGMQPSGATLNEINTSMPGELAARVIPIAFSALIMVIAVAISALVSLKVFIHCSTMVR